MTETLKLYHDIDHIQHKLRLSGSHASQNLLIFKSFKFPASVSSNDTEPTQLSTSGCWAHLVGVIL